jgi:hypothetical protein
MTDYHVRTAYAEDDLRIGAISLFTAGRRAVRHLASWTS